MDERSKIRFDDGQASVEGWGVFDTGGRDRFGAPQWRILCDDENGAFRDDFEARVFVLNSAFDGSEYHRDALALHLGAALRDA